MYLHKLWTRLGMILRKYLIFDILVVLFDNIQIGIRIAYFAQSAGRCWNLNIIRYCFVHINVTSRNIIKWKSCWFVAGQGRILMADFQL